MPALIPVVEVEAPMITVARECDRATDEQGAGEPLVKEEPSEYRDEDRADVHQHGRGSGVDPTFGLIECDVVDAEPQDAAGSDPGPCGTRRHPLTSRHDEDAEEEAADAQPGQRQGSC